MKTKFSFQEFIIFLIAIICSFSFGILFYFLFKSFSYDELTKEVLDCNSSYNSTILDEDEKDHDVVKLD